MDPASLVVLLGILATVLVVSAFSVRHLVCAMRSRNTASHRRHGAGPPAWHRQHRRRQREEYPTVSSNTKPPLVRMHIQTPINYQRRAPSSTPVPWDNSGQPTTVHLVQLPNRMNFALGTKA
jgi:hypothetical protein